MKRQHIHFSKGLPGESGVISGMRKSSQVLIYINAKKAMDGLIIFKFFYFICFNFVYLYLTFLQRWN